MRNKKLINRRNDICCSPLICLGKGRGKKRKKSYTRGIVGHPAKLTLLSGRIMSIKTTLSVFFLRWEKYQKEKKPLVRQGCESSTGLRTITSLIGKHFPYNCLGLTDEHKRRFECDVFNTVTSARVLSYLHYFSPIQVGRIKIVNKRSILQVWLIATLWFLYLLFEVGQLWVVVFFIARFQRVTCPRPPLGQKDIIIRNL